MNKVKISLVLVAIFTSTLTPSANAIEDGTKAPGNSYVVPIVIDTSNACTGVMISVNVLATAAHCILDSSKQISKSIYVGRPGLKFDNSSSTKVTHTFIPDDYLGNSSDNKVGDSDIAFLVLEYILLDYGVVEIASENDLSSLKAKRAPLRVIGYGTTSNSGDNNQDPHYFDGVFESEYRTPMLNSFAVTSSKGNVCAGDSGSPILSITPKKVMLIGILTGTFLNEGGKCSQKSPFNTYMATFSGVSRYSNALHLALVQGSENLMKANRQIGDIYYALEKENTELARMFSEVQAEVEILRKMKKVITCWSGSKSKTVVGLNPKCPVGYKKK